MMNEKIDDLRSKISVVKAEISETRNSRKSSEEVLSNVQTLVSREADEFIRMAGIDAIGANEARLARPAISRASRENPLGLLCAVFPDRVESMILSNISDGGLRLSNAERNKKLAAMESRLGKLERDEEAEIERLEAAGHFVIRRGDACPFAVLGMDKIAK
jgi:septal ring factor EnvC (AmiA/AmiB activator)